MSIVIETFCGYCGQHRVGAALCSKGEHWWIVQTTMWDYRERVPEPFDTWEDAGRAEG